MESNNKEKYKLTSDEYIESSNYAIDLYYFTSEDIALETKPV